MRGPDPQDAVWFVYHVPKTGGQTIRNHLRATLGPDLHRHLGRWVVGDEKPSVERVLADGAARARAITGHEVTRDLARWFPGRPFHEVLILREPVERILSRYRFRNWFLAQLGKGPEDWDRFIARSVHRDPMTRWVAGFVGEDRIDYRLDAALYALRTMTAVTDTAALDRVLPHLLEAMGLPPVIPERANRSGVEIPLGDEVGPDIIAELRRRTQQDEILHRAAAALTERTIERLRAIADAGPTRQPDAGVP